MSEKLSIRKLIKEGRAIAYIGLLSLFFVSYSVFPQSPSTYSAKRNYWAAQIPYDDLGAACNAARLTYSDPDLAITGWRDPIDYTSCNSTGQCSSIWDQYAECITINGPYPGWMIALSVSYTCPNGGTPSEITVVENTNYGYTREKRQICSNAPPCANPLYVRDERTGTCGPGPKNDGPFCPATKLPINIGSGNKFLAETDYISSGQLPFQITRHFNSYGNYTGRFGKNWRMFPELKVSSPGLVSYSRADHKMFFFRIQSGSWIPDADIKIRLSRLTNPSNATTGWRAITDRDVIEAYNADGTLASVRDRYGLGYSISWNFSGGDTTLTDSLGRVILLRFGASNLTSHTESPRLQ